MLNEKEFLKEISYITSKECKSKEKSFEKIKEYIENGGDINIRFPDLGDTALLRLSKVNCIESIQIAILLIQNDKCDLNAQDFTGGDSVLMNAIEHNNYEIAELLIKDKRCNLNLLNELHHSALIICCDNNDKSEKNTNIAKLLIDYEDCNLNVRSVHDSSTALMIACLRKNYKIAELLIKNKRCSVNLRNSSGSTVLLYLQYRKKFHSMPELVDDLRIEEDLIDLLMQREDICFDEGELEGESFPIRAILSHDAKIINQLLSNKKFKLNLISYDRNVLYTIPVDTTKLFMQRKKFNWNALYFKVPIFYNLLHRGLSTFFIKEFEQAINDKECNVNETNPQGDSLLMEICLVDIQIDRIVLNQESLIELARVLINNDNCDINLKNKQGYTAFWYACKGNKKRIVELFLQSKNFIIDETIVYPNDENLIIAFFAKKRNRIGTLLVSIKTCQKMDSKKRKTEFMEENPFRILPKELIHLTLSYAYPFIPQTKYCKNE